MKYRETYLVPDAGRNDNESAFAAAQRDSVLVVEVPDERVGLSLINHLSSLHAELSPVDDTRCTVRVELAEWTLEALIDTLKRLRSWQSCVGMQTLRAHFGRRVYTITAS